MPRIRSLKPEFCTSEVIVALSIPCRLHFVQLWTYADDEGRGVDNARLLKAALWPLDDDIDSEQVESWQKELESNGRIVRYEVGGKRFFEIVNFSEHQRPSHPQPSKFPPSPSTSAWDSRNSPGSFPECSGNDPGTVTPVVVVGVVVGEVEGEGVGDGQSAELPLTDRALAIVPDSVPLLPSGFDAFWTRCPRKVGKPKAQQSWKAARGRGVSESTILAGMDRWAAYWRDAGTEPQFIPHPSTWLRREDWNDEPPPLSRLSLGSGGRPSPSDDRMEATRRVAERFAAQEAAGQ